MTREEAVKWIKTAMDNYDFFPETEEVLKLAIESLSAEELVRCKDCRHAEHRCQMENQVYCFRDKLCPHGYLRDDDDFCKYGERREECD